MRYLFENYTLDAEKRELHRGADAVSITPQAFDLLDYLIRNRERVVSKDDLIIAVWNGRIVSDAALTTRLNAARNAIGDSGEEQRLLKTLARKGFRFVGQVQEERGGAAPDNWAEPPKCPLTLPTRPSVAVLPFVNLSLDPEQEYFADGVVEDITMALSRFHWLFVIARNSSFTYKGRSVDVRQVGRELGVRYVLEGSVRKAGNRLRIAGQLIDAETGAHLWAGHFDGALEDMFDLQDHVTWVQSHQSCSARRSSGQSANQLKIWMHTTIICVGWPALVGGPGTRTPKHSGSFARQSNSIMVWPAPMAWPRGATCDGKRVAG